MRTRRGEYGASSLTPPPTLTTSTTTATTSTWRRAASTRAKDAGDMEPAPKRARLDCARQHHRSLCLLDPLPDDLLLSIFVSLSSSARCPSDLIGPMLTCKRFQRLASHSLVLANASTGALSFKASRWCEDAHRFLARCAEAGSAKACYALGMIRFYCLEDRAGGVQALAAAGAAMQADALHALAIIHMNGSGGMREDKDLRAGVRLCARAAALRHVEAMRELGHCLQDGYGVPKNVAAGRRLILEANAREVLQALMAGPSLASAQRKGPTTTRAICKCLQAGALLSDYGCAVPPARGLHFAHAFLLDWFSCVRRPPPGLRLCSYPLCGRPETRKHEFRRCSACASVNYCSRACQALHWKLQHKLHCNHHHHHHHHPPPPPPPLPHHQFMAYPAMPHHS